MQIAELIGLFKRRPRVEDTGSTRVETLERRTAAARKDIRRKWARFCITARLGGDASLVDGIDRFVELTQRYIASKHPVLLHGSGHDFWFAVFAAILESGTHPSNEVKAAIRVLKDRYGRR